MIIGVLRCSGKGRYRPRDELCCLLRITMSAAALAAQQCCRQPRQLPPAQAPEHCAAAAAPQIIVGCQKGLRSLAACEQLLRGGYSNVTWVNGGFDASRRGEIPTEGGIDIR